MGTGSPSLAAYLPREIIDHILSFYFIAAQISLHDWVHCEIKDEHEIARVCHSWRGPVQRYLLREVAIRRTTSLIPFTRTLASPSEAGQLVRILSLSLSEGVQNRTTQHQDVNRLLLLLPNLTELRIQIGDKSHQTDYQDLSPLSNLQKLTLDSTNLGHGLTFYRHFLLKAPNITSLTLTNASGAIPHLSNRHLTPIDLPSLTHLSLQSFHFCTYFNRLNLISDDTLSQITHLEMMGTGPPHDLDSPLDLLDKIGRNMTTLSLGATFPTVPVPLWYRNRLAGQQDVEFVHKCQNLTTLIANHPLVLPSDEFLFPPTLTKIIVEARCGDPSWLMSESVVGMPGISQKVEDWRYIKAVEIRGVEKSPWVNEKELVRKELVRSLEEKGVAAILSGVIAPSWVC